MNWLAMHRLELALAWRGDCEAELCDGSSFGIGSKLQMLEIRYAHCGNPNTACQVEDTILSISSIRPIQFVLALACATMPIAVRRFQNLFDKQFWKFDHVRCQLFAYLEKNRT